MLNSGKKIRASCDKKNKYYNSHVRIFFLNEAKNHNPPPPTHTQVKWSVP